MALYRTVNLSFWTDDKIVDDFTPEDKYFYLYLFTNPQTNMCGCYKVSIKTMADQLGYAKDSVENLITRFEKVHNIVKYSKDTKEILLLNWNKYNWQGGKQISCLTKEISEVKCEEFHDYLANIFNNRFCSDEDSPCIPLISPLEAPCKPLAYPLYATVTVTDTVTDTVTVNNINNINNNNNNINNTVNNDLEEIVEYYNTRCTELPKCTKLTDERKKKLKARLKKFTKEDFFNAFDKAAESDFLNGKNSDWRASFNWFIDSDNNLIKVLEDNYKNSKFSSGYNSVPQSKLEQIFNA